MYKGNLSFKVKQSSKYKGNHVLKHSGIPPPTADKYRFKFPLRNYLMRSQGIGGIQSLTLSQYRNNGLLEVPVILKLPTSAKKFEILSLNLLHVTQIKSKLESAT